MEKLERDRPAGGDGPLPRTIVLGGSPSQIGVAHGQLLGAEIRFLIRRVGWHVFQRIDPVRRPGLRIAARTLAFILGRYIPERIREEIRGISAGSGASYADLLLMNTLDDVLNILRRLAPRMPSMACSSFVVFGAHTSDGDLLHGRNLDYHFRGTSLDDNGEVSRLLLRYATLFAYHPAGRTAFISIAWPGIVGVTTAMNQAGLCLGNLTSYLRGTTPNGVPATILYRTIAEQAASPRDVGQLLRAARRTIGNNLVASSGPENRAVLFEITKDSVEEVAPEDGMLVAANHFVSPLLAGRQRLYLPAHSVARRERLRSLCEQGDIGVDKALTILVDTGDGGASHPFARIANEGTAVSVLFRPAAHELWLGTSREPPASQGKFRRVDTGRLLKA